MTNIGSEHIAVLKGGPGTEREISLASAAGVSSALRSLGATVTEIDVRDDRFTIPNDSLIAFNVIHGTFGEDGHVQRILDKRRTKYTGEDAARSTLAFDKIATKERLQAAGVPTAAFSVLHETQFHHVLPLPLVIKPSKQGSSVGVYIVQDEEAWGDALADAWAKAGGGPVFIEQFIPGRELTVGILGDQALPVIEILPAADGFYDWQAKYPFLTGKPGAGHACPANLTEHERALVQATALAAHRALGLQTYSRVDLILAEDGTAYVLELNTIPGMTPSSLLPEAAAAAGIPYPQLCERILALSLARYT